MQSPSGSNILTPEAVSTPEGSIIETSPSTIRGNNSPVPIPESCLSSTFLPVGGVIPCFAPQHRLALPPASPQGWTIVDMELMHHFTLAGPGFLAASEKMHDIWQVTVPKLAFSDKSGCAMHGILALSSLHLAFLEVENRSARLINATAHYDQAVRIMGAMVPNICKDNYESLFIASTLIVVFATASPLLPGHANTENGPWTLPEWLPLIRGVYSILKEVGSWMENGCLSPILKFHLYDGPDPVSDDIDKALNDLYRLCTDTSEPAPEEIKNTDVSSTYFGAIHELRKSFVGSADPKHNPISLIFIWPICTSDKYVALLKQRRPRALIIFAYYCVLLKRMEVHWWLRGRAEYELVRIEKSIQELEKWRKWLEWPTKMVRGELPT